MPEKKYVEITLKLEDEVVERLKGQLKAAGYAHWAGATAAVQKVVELFGSYSRSVRLDEPERKEIESRVGAHVPIRSSKDILRAVEKLAGGPDAVNVELDPGLGGLMRDVARGMGYGISEFCKMVIENSYWDHYIEQCELRPLFFDQNQWKSLTEMAGTARIRSAVDILALIRELRRQKDEPCFASVDAEEKQVMRLNPQGG